VERPVSVSFPAGRHRPDRTDVAVIGGGFYGAFVANEIKTLDPDLEVTLVEKEDALFTRASSTNQGQFHMGYMYSADRALALECAENVERFHHWFGPAIDREVLTLFGIHEDSGISPADYVRFCEDMRLPLHLIDRPRDVFGDAVIATFRSAETTFNSAAVQRILAQRMARTGVRLVRGFGVHRVEETSNGLRLTGHGRSLIADHVFNVTFADINALHERSGLPAIPLRYDTFLHFVLELPAPYRHTGATVIRGPYASLLPSSFHRGHVLASAPHRRVRGGTTSRPAEAIRGPEVRAVYDRAVADAIAYLPVLGKATLRGHTIGTRAAQLDPRTGAYTSKALVFSNAGDLTNYHVVLGGKVSCLFDVAGTVAAIIRRPVAAPR
jgi:glycine/D-amino acid oxidase-like deaminating enzyme